MDEHLEGLLDTLEILCESACDAYEPYKAWPSIQEKIQEIKKYLENVDCDSEVYRHSEGCYGCC